VDDHPFIARLRSLGIPFTSIVVGTRSYAREYRALRALVARLKPGVIHTHGYRADIIGGAVAKANSIPTVSTVHGFTGGSKRNRFNQTLQCFALRFADAVIAVSKPLVEVLRTAGVPRERICLIPNGFGPPDKILTRAAAREKLGLADDAWVVGWVGRLSPEKGPDVMVSALARSHPAWRLSMIGDGRERHNLIAQAAKLGIGDRMTLHGEVADAGAVFAAFDAFVLSSRTEGTPIALFEAMWANIPVVATAVGGIPDVVTSVHAFLVPPEQPGAIGDALNQIRRDPAGAANRAKEASYRLSQRFSLDAWVDAVDEAYRRVVG
jgi:glycosyltransferase involved in cell wall biosynthesis